MSNYIISRTHRCNRRISDLKKNDEGRHAKVITALNRLEKNQGNPYQIIRVGSKTTCFHRVMNVGLIVTIVDDIRQLDSFWFFDETLK